MSQSVLGRLVRPAILIVAGMVLGQGALAVAVPAAPQATTQTRVSSCAGFDFQPIDALTVARWDGRIRYRDSEQGDGWLMCNADLPHRAVVTKVRYTVVDRTDLQQLEYCGLVRTPLAETGAVQTLAFPITATGMADKPGTKRYATTSIQKATVDNGAFAYSLQCHIVWDPTLHGVGGAYAGVIGADVTYRISSTNG